jgi:hypothetical protein
VTVVQIVPKPVVTDAIQYDGGNFAEVLLAAIAHPSVIKVRVELKKGEVTPSAFIVYAVTYGRKEDVLVAGDWLLLIHDSPDGRLLVMGDVEKVAKYDAAP